MPTANKKDEIVKKLEYLGLNLEKLPKTITQFEDLEYRIPKFYDENKYRQYRYVNVNDIQILLSPTNRLDDLEDKYKKSSPLADYLDNKTEENYIKHTTFLNMLKKVEIDKIKEIEKEQEKLNKAIPFKVKFSSNYLWQIYYSKNTDKYFMIVPTQDSEYEAFFYLLKKKLENKKNAKVYVPIIGVDYSNEYLKKSEFQDIENYMWLFTKDWPLIYEVYDKKDNMTIQIIGETEVFGKIKSIYRVKLEDKEEATNFYKLIKAMFIIQTELPNYFNFKTNIDAEGTIEFYHDDRKLKYKDIANWIKVEYVLCEENKQEKAELIKINKEKLEKKKLESVLLEQEYIEKEKQISTFLECKKTFFGKVKYYFKYGKSKKSKNKQDVKNKENTEEKNEIIEESKNDFIEKDNYTLEELIQNYKEYEEKENNLKNIIMDLNALKLKNKNLEKKIENATIYIKEIDSHKKSIFEFWKYSNKDEMATLPEGEQEEVNVVKKIEKVFDYEEDIEDFGKKYDKILRKTLSQEETDSIFIEEKTLSENDEFDIFGGIIEDSTKIKKIKDKKHRELPKDRFKILDINKKTNLIGYKLSLEQIMKNINTALEKMEIEEDMPVYKAIADEEINKNNINIFNINPESELKETINCAENTINLYKINLKGKIKAIPYANIIFYDNQNKTLPTGMDLTSKILIDISKLKLEEESNSHFNILDFENDEDEFSKINIKSVNVIEYSINEEEVS